MFTRHLGIFSQAFMDNLMCHRVATGLALATIVYAVFFFYAPIAQWVIALVFIIAAYEWGKLLENKLRCLIYPPLCLCIWILLYVLSIEIKDTALLFSPVMIWWLLVVALLMHPRILCGNKKFLPWLLRLHFCIALPACWLAMTLLYQEKPLYLLYVIIIASVFDTSAYFGGSVFKGRKLLPTVSPGKTWSGVYCGILSSFLVGCSGAFYFVQPWDWWMGLAWISITILTGVASVAGDLSISILKRHVQASDSGTILPGHGGMLDRIDSSLSALPVFLSLLVLIHMQT